MASLDESDQTLTTGEVTDGVLVDGEESKKSRSGIFGLVAIFCSAILIVLSLFANFHGNANLAQDTDSKIRVELTLTAHQFLTGNSANSCNGSGDLKGINTSSLIVKKSAWSQKVTIGSGTLNNKGQCIYNISVYPPSNFTGGVIELTAVFPFGSSSTLKHNVGESAPWKPAVMSIPLD